MNTQDFVYLDVRWREDGWLEAIRLRLSGWLPDNLVAQGVEKGVFEEVRTRDRKYFGLSARGLALTDVRPHSLANENCSQLAQVLLLNGYSEEWIKAGGDGSVECPEALLEATYRAKLMSFLSPTSLSSTAGNPML
ncbi:hypothetical protein PVV74_17635 [Roseovarius sp. SK2]|uniref:hypothetical protein n=1 Tax=Roseovarius TaxID=74030 RepID=UPI00237B422E|nr:hypothetical protein [Roseovarius sp. SK2]MDD9727285.1 hypothetical protein [Roseovarius sp. SK2]